MQGLAINPNELISVFSQNCVLLDANVGVCVLNTYAWLELLV